MMFFTLDGFVSKPMFETRSGSSFLFHILRHLIIWLRGSHSRCEMSQHVRSRQLPGLRWGFSARFSIQQKFDFCPFHKARSWSHWLMVRLSGLRRGGQITSDTWQSSRLQSCRAPGRHWRRSWRWRTCQRCAFWNFNNKCMATNIPEQKRRKGKSGFRLFCWLWSALAKLAVCTALLAARTRGESDMTKVVPYFLKQIYSNKQRIVL